MHCKESVFWKIKNRAMIFSSFSQICSQTKKKLDKDLLNNLSNNGLCFLAGSFIILSTLTR